MIDRTHLTILALAALAASSRAQVILGSQGPSETYPNLQVSTDSRTVQGTFTQNGFHYSVDLDLDVRSATGSGYGIQGYIVTFRTGPEPVYAYGITTSWRGTHTMSYDDPDTVDDTPVLLDDRLVKFDDANGNGYPDGIEAQTDLIGVPYIAGTIRDSSTIDLSGRRSFNGGVMLAPNSNYFYGGSNTFNLSGPFMVDPSPGPFEFSSSGRQTFDIAFSPTLPVPEPSALAALALGALCLLRRHDRESQRLA